MTWFQELFGPAPIVTPSEAGRALSAPRRAADRARKADKLQQLKREIAAGGLPKWEGWA